MKLVLTLAAGNDWTEPDPAGRVDLVQGSFHGPILAESLLQAILFMNQHMPRMINNFKNRDWNRNTQTNSRLLSQQTILIISFGSIGSHCARLISNLGARVTGIKRNPQPKTIENISVFGVDDLLDLMSQADHVVFFAT